MVSPIYSDQTDHNPEIKALLEENNRLLKEVKAGNERLEHYLRWHRIWSVLRLFIILAPLLLGIIFLRPYIQTVADVYQELLYIPTR